MTGMIAGVPTQADVAGNDGSGKPISLEIHLDDGNGGQDHATLHITVLPAFEPIPSVPTPFPWITVPTPNSGTGLGKSAATCEELGWIVPVGAKACGTSWVAEGAACSAKLSQSESVKICRGNEARLCTSAEIVAGI